MRLPYAAGPDEGDVAVRVEVGQRRELAQRGRVPALDPGEVEALEGLGLAPGQPAQPQQRLDGGEPPLLRKVGEGGCHGGHLPVAEVEVRGEGRELLRPDGDPEPRRGVARELVGARPRARHHSALPKSNLSKPGFVLGGAICSTTVPTGWVGSSSGCAGDVSHCPSHQLSAPVPTAWATSSRERSSLYMCTTRPSTVHPALAADVPVGHAVAVPLEAHEAVEGDLPARAQVPLDLGRDLERPGVRRARRLVLAHRDACRRAPPAASLLGAPEGGLPVEGVKVGKGPSREEVPLHEADEPLHLALRIGVARPAQPGAEADDAHELGVVGLPDGPAVGIAADDHALHVVGEHGRGHARRRERVQHPDEEVLLARVREELDVGAPAMVADHGEAGDPRPLPARALDRDEAPVHLVGLSGRRPEALAAAALRGRLPPLRGHEVPVRGDIGLHRGEAAGVALAEQPLEYHLRVGDALPQEVVHQAGVAGEHARRGPPPRPSPGAPRL